jgi:diguanylate cyclase (GGDEF)-like protein/PAS domain S-box-containing protein
MLPNDPAFYKNLLDVLFDGVYFLDANRVITYWNKAAERISGYSGEEVIGRGCADSVFIHVDELGVSLCPWELCPAAACLRSKQPQEKEAFLLHKQGHRVPVHLRVTPVTDASGAVVGVVQVFSDDTSQNEALKRIEELERLALLDPATEIPNRRYAENTLTALMEETARYGWTFGVLFADIDNFKLVNDEHGHDVGDRVLRMTAQTLLHAVRTYDVVCRWGGEEFMVLVRNVRAEQVALVAEKCRALVAQSKLSTGVALVGVTISLGATVVQSDDSIATLLRRADQLMYRSKQAGKNRVSS